jgi:hypothetical protein
VLAPTPPPDIDLEAWRSSLDVIAGWSPRGLAITHFGAHTDVQRHLAALREHLDQVEAMARELDEASFVAAMRARVVGSAATGAAIDADVADVYDRATSARQNFRGLERYLGRRGPAT